MLGNSDEEKDERSPHECFSGYLPCGLYDKAKATLNKMFHANRADHIKAVELGRGHQLQSSNIYVQTKKIAVHEAGHVMAVWYSGSGSTLSRATIKYGWGYYHDPLRHTKPIKDRQSESMTDFFEDMCYCLSGRIAESMFFPEDKPHFPYFMCYPGSDIHQAVNLAYYMAKTEHGIKKISTSMTQDFLDDVSCYLIRAYQATTDLLKRKTEKLMRVALSLLEKVTIRSTHLWYLLGPPPKKKFMSLYDQYCAFSMQLRPLQRKKYYVSKGKTSKKTKKRKTKLCYSTKKKYSKTSSKKNQKYLKKNVKGSKKNVKRSKRDLKGSKNNSKRSKNNSQGSKNNSKGSQNNPKGSKKNRAGVDSKSSRKRKKNTTYSKSPKKRLTNSRQVITVFN